MKPVSLSPFPIATLARWIARCIAVLLIAIVLLFMIGTGGVNPLKLSTVEAVQMTFWLATCVGLVVAWRWEFLGGLVATAGIALFFGTELAVAGRWPHSWVFDLALLPGVLFLLSATLRRWR
jgi:hypothetical protein